MPGALEKVRRPDIKAILPEIAKELDDVSSRPSRQALQPLRKMLEGLEKGWPPATSGEVLSSRVRW